MSQPAIPLLDLKAQYETIRKEMIAAVTEVMESQRFILGPEVQAMEQEIAQYCQAGHCIGVSSGSDALLISLMALDVGHGDEVITSPYTFFATGGAIARVGATPVFADIRPDSYNIDPAEIGSKITSKTKAIIPVHLYGQCADMTTILEIANRHGLPVIEDAAQALGAEHRGRRAGSIGTVGCFSFFPSKNLGACGDGGAVTTNDAELAEKIRCMRVHGSKPKYYHSVIGGNFRLDALQAAVIRVKLRHLDRWTAGRQHNAANYDRLFAASGLTRSLAELPNTLEDRHVYNQYIVRVRDRDQVLAHLKANQIGCEIYYPVPLHLQQCFAHLGYKTGDLPESEAAAQSTLALPVYPELTSQQQQQIVDSIVEYYRSAGDGEHRHAA